MIIALAKLSRDICLNPLVIFTSAAQNKVNVQVMQKQILPVSLFFAISLVLSNKAYIYLSVSYIQARD